jgi:hypothetical protein
MALRAMPGAHEKGQPDGLAQTTTDGILFVHS